MTTARFRVCTTATGCRRTVLVIVHPTVATLRAAATATDGLDHSNAAAVCQLAAAYTWPRPAHLPLVMRFHRDELYTEVIAHESTHAAAEIVFADSIRGWDARARTYLRGGFEPLAYAAGELTQRIVTKAFALGLIAPSRRA